NERLSFARHFVEKKGYSLADAEARNRAKEYLLTNFARVVNEQTVYAESLETARKNGDANEEFAERSRLYRERGLSSDTSLPPDFAIAEALGAMKARGLLARDSIRRVAVVGPGLDFTDKQDGYDFYPQQTLQPFAIMDSLFRLGLASPQNLDVATLDLSPRINEHLTRTAEKPRQGIGYTVQLPFEATRGWKPELTAYWTGFGERIGVQVEPARVPSAFTETRVRAVRIKPQYVSRVSPLDLNIVLQRLDLGPGEKFDLI